MAGLNFQSSNSLLASSTHPCSNDGQAQSNSCTRKIVDVGGSVGVCSYPISVKALIILWIICVCKKNKGELLLYTKIIINQHLL